ncbi:DNA/RNA helicase, superfamily II [Aciduliprofundum sp. MAR08-339]|uniref:DEAD/DEAH box helicase family protein n=1 Tax=Aciduliprofundum sp. (strain MAR08-339) TaxID=673860 RepID=UPI0002A4802A|nr:DNA/RNA helicase, superfamily II [Aciduliprofundum sp. MAR08-339]
MPRGKNKTTNSKRLDDYLVLNHYMCSLFGYDSFKELKKQFEDVEDGYDEEGHSYMYHRILSLKNLDPRIRDKMDDYDANIYGYLKHINAKRDFQINLKYFQYLAVLFTEIFLDRYFQDPIQLMNEITQFGWKNKRKYDDEANLYGFTPQDLRTLAFWMATGSGKTIIMHINYLQFLKYNKGPHKINYENIILITPNAGLSAQHKKELELSSIPAVYFIEESGTSFSGDYPPVKIIEITKFVENKKGEGVSISTKSVTSKNIVFADEAHKGAGGDAWKKYREDLSKNGFRFEYSATFGQALKNISPGDELLQSYAKSIIFDYSYKYFYGDGYGKDYRIINTRTLTEDLQYTFLLANALSFYEQVEVYSSNEGYRKKYHIERPLWVFIGSTVQPKNRKKESKKKGLDIFGNKEDRKTVSDILKVVKFINKFINDESWAIRTIERVLQGRSGILDKEGNDVFARTYPETNFPFLRGGEISARKIYEDMKRKIFKISTKDALHLVNIKNAEGEIGLKIGPFGKYFGVINIGDKEGFLKFIKDNAEEYGMVVERDDTTNSLFEGIENSSIDILIGARKFVEGWNSWRVSTMGLINMGKTEGPLVIQLFGRGVRLKGYNKMLKRSTAIPNVAHPEHISILETLNIFGIQANYMEVFKGYLEKEGVPTEPQREFFIPTKIHEIIEKGSQKLTIPKLPSKVDFRKSAFLKLEKDEHIKINLDLRPRATILSSKEEKALLAQSKDISSHIDPGYLDLLNWNYIYREIVEYKMERGLYNLKVSKDALKDILMPEVNGKFIYDLYLPDPRKVMPAKMEDLEYLEDLTIRILKKYVYKYYMKHKMMWETSNLKYDYLSSGDKELLIDKYTIKIKLKDLQKFKELVDLLENEDFEPLYGEYDNIIKNVYIDVHLYQPLLKDHPEITIIPKGLNEGEEKFIEYLKIYLSSISNQLQKKDIYVYVLRNRTRGKGIGFFENYGFYPDFIVWIKRKDIEHIIFVEPHGLAHFSERDKEKIELHRKLKELEKKLNEKYERNITLNSYIISVTPYDTLKYMFNMSKDQLENSHILFMEDKIKAVEKIISPFIK